MRQETSNPNFFRTESPVLTVTDIANDLKNQVNFILINSQLLMDIWNDAVRFLTLYQGSNPAEDIYLSGLDLSEVREVVPAMLEANLLGLGRVSDAANLIHSNGLQSNLS